MADETLDVELSEAVKEAFYPALKSQLIKHLGESDSTLFEYIVLLISNKRTKTHIVNDLQAFFNDSAKEFTDWLWDFLKPFERQEVSGIIEDEDGLQKEDKEAPSSSSGSSSSKRDEHGRRSKRESSEKDKGDRSEKEKGERSERSEKRSERSDRERRRSASPKEKRAKPSGHSAGASRLFGSALSKNTDPPRETTRRKRDVVKSSNDKDEESPEEDVPQKEENGKDVSSIKVSKVVVKKRRTRSRSPAKDGEQEDADQSRERTRDRDRKDSVKDERRDGKGRERERRSTRSSTDPKSVKSDKKKVTPLFTITLDGAPPVKPLPQEKREIEEEEDDFIMGGGTRANVAVVARVPELKSAVMPGLSLQDGELPPEIQSILDEPIVGTSLGAPLPLGTLRCKFWPKCTKEDCPFHHPKEICPYFPACKFGPTCLFIHVVSGRGRGRGKPAFRGFRGGYRGRGGHYVAEPEEASEYPPTRGRGGYRGRVRGRGRGGPANVTKVFDATGVVCHFDTICNAIGCPYSHPAREKQEQSFLSSSDPPEQPTTPVPVATQEATAAPAIPLKVE